MEDNTLKNGQRTGYKGWGVRFTNETLELESMEGVMEYLESSEEDNGYNNDYTCGSANDNDDGKYDGIYNEECNEEEYGWYQGCCGCYLLGDIEDVSIDNIDDIYMNEYSYITNKNMSIDDLLESKRSNRR